VISQGPGWLAPRHPGRAARPARTRPQLPGLQGGRRAGPPEDCGGAWAFLDLRQRHRLPIVAARAADLLLQLLDAADDVDGDDALDGITACRRELAELQRWLTIDRFDRRAVKLEGSPRLSQDSILVCMSVRCADRRRSGTPPRSVAR
jgi:hypothetical protein